jgi:hypothetical protein
VTALLLGLALGIALPGHAAPPAPALRSAPADIDRLVQLMMPPELVAGLGTRAFAIGFDRQVAADPVRKAQFDADPAMRAAIIGQLSGEVQRILIARLPELRGKIGSIVTAELTPAEISDSLTFFASPTGRRLTAQTYAAMATNPGASPEQMQQAATAALMKTMTPDDYPALMAFASSSAANKMVTITPRISAAGLAWSQQLVAANKPRIDALTERAIADYLARKAKP